MNVPNIPRFYYGNNVYHEVHRNNVVQEAHETVPQSKTHSVVHYQMALDQVGRRLTEFRSTRELVTAIADAMEGLSILTRVHFVCLCPVL